MYEELISELRKGYTDRFNDAADAIEDLQKLMDAQLDIIKQYQVYLTKQHWISVAERLPETPGEYMVAYHPCYWDRVHDEIKVGLDSFRGKTSWAKKKYQRVTHWMPLPEPPKEET